MTIKQTVKKLAVTTAALLFLVVSVVATSATTVSAAECGKDFWGNPVQTSVLSCNKGGGADITQSGLWGVLEIAIGVLTAGVGVAALAGIIFGVILYTTSAGDPAGLKKALEVLRNVAIGVICYAFMWSLLQWLIPGGVFS